jgi:hypothetical protein
MKSLSLTTPLVRINKSSGGQPAVYMFASIVSAVIVSAFWYIAPLEVGGDSGCNVADDDTESSTSSEREEDGAGDVSLIAVRLSPLWCLWARSFCVIRVSENGVLCGGPDVEYSSTVVLIAVVISSRDV